MRPTRVSHGECYSKSRQSFFGLFSLREDLRYLIARGLAERFRNSCKSIVRDGRVVGSRRGDFFSG